MLFAGDEDFGDEITSGPLEDDEAAIVNATACIMCGAPPGEPCDCGKDDEEDEDEDD